MRQILFILLTATLSIAHVTALEHEAPEQIPITLDPFLDKIKNYLKAQSTPNADVTDLLTILGVSEINSASQSTKYTGDSWLSSVIIDRKKLGVFSLVGNTSNAAFIAPESTDIAIQASLDLSHLTRLIREIHKANGTQESGENFLAQSIAGIEIETFLQSSRPTIHLCADFDDHEILFLGKESIGRPHVAIRIDGSHKMFEAVLNHFISTRNALFTKQITASGKLFTLPAYFAKAIADYQPVISFDEIKNTTTIASSKAMLDRLEDPSRNLTTDPSFIKTWESMPKKSSIKVYVSKHSLRGLHHFYKLALKEKWTDNPSFTQKKFLFTGAMTQLNSSESGLAFALASDENKDTITLKSAFPSTMLLWILGQ